MLNNTTFQANASQNDHLSKHFTVAITYDCVKHLTMSTSLLYKTHYYVQHIIVSSKILCPNLHKGTFDHFNVFKKKGVKIGKKFNYDTILKNLSSTLLSLMSCDCDDALIRNNKMWRRCSLIVLFTDLNQSMKALVVIHVFLLEKYVFEASGIVGFPDDQWFKLFSGRTAGKHYGKSFFCVFATFA